MMRFWLAVSFMLILAAPVAHAQNPPVYVIPVAIPAADALTLVGEYYLIDVARPTVLLLHEMYTDRGSWGPVIPHLLAAGYNALAVDTRGYGQTGGAIDWDKAVEDTQVWIDWLRAHNARSIALMGSSMGSTLAILGCANDPGCQGVIAISPGWNYYDQHAQPAFAETLGARPALLIYGADDPWPARGVPRMVKAATNPVEVKVFPGNAHGMLLFESEDMLIPLITEWLRRAVG